MYVGLKTPGLFNDQVAIDQRSEVDNLKKKIVFGRDFWALQRFKLINLITEKDSVKLSRHTQDPLIVGEMLRHWLASLPEPLLTFALYDSFLIILSKTPAKGRLIA